MTSESDWKNLLCGFPEWKPPIVPTLVISPHPDDETLGAGGLINSLNGEASVVAVTDGENAYAGEISLGPIREAEQTKALAELGVPAQRIKRFHLPDSGLHMKENELVELLRPLVRKGSHVIAPWTGDFHPDHEVCGRASRKVAEEIGASLTFYFFWTWHRGTPATIRSLKLVRFALNADQLHRKNKALSCHRSQLEHSSGEPILPQYLLEPMQRPYEVFLPL